jgi:hypothetical protein
MESNLRYSAEIPDDTNSIIVGKTAWSLRDCCVTQKLQGHYSVAYKLVYRAFLYSADANSRPVMLNTAWRRDEYVKHDSVKIGLPETSCCCITLQVGRSRISRTNISFTVFSSNYPIPPSAVGLGVCWKFSRNDYEKQIDMGDYSADGA